MIFRQSTDYSLFISRRNRLIETIHERFGWQGPSMLLLIGECEEQRHIFRQNSSFYYLTGIIEPGVVACCDFDDNATLYIPRFGERRDKWATTSIHATSEPKKIGFNEIRFLGNTEESYFFKPAAGQEQYTKLIDDVRSFTLLGGKIFTVSLQGKGAFCFGRLLLQHLCSWIPGLKDQIIDATRVVDSLRRIKDQYEISLIHQAAQVTSLAQEAAAQIIEPEKMEYEVQAMVDYIFATTAGSQPAFPSIVATGKNTTTLHYTDRNCALKDGDLVIIDVGAEYGYYAADLTRTYPVNGKFSTRQRELYSIVLDVQKYIESIAMPGMCLCNNDHKDQSLHHLALKYLTERNVAQYWCHGIGHFLGLDVHDVGTLSDPLMPGDVFTIEPGLYLPQEQCGIRIEDDYVMVEDGVVCLSSDLVKEPDEIEDLMVKDQ
jgi:Xaa-Pro aminopeptidase